MIKVPENENNLELNVFLKNGKTFLNKDVPNQPMGKNERVVSFWNDDRLMVYPMEQIDHIEIIF